MRITRRQLQEAIINSITESEDKERLQLLDDVEGLFDTLYGDLDGIKVPNFNAWDSTALSDYLETLMSASGMSGGAYEEDVSDEDTYYPSSEVDDDEGSGSLDEADRDYSWNRTGEKHAVRKNDRHNAAVTVGNLLDQLEARGDEESRNMSAQLLQVLQVLDPRNTAQHTAYGVQSNHS